MEKIDFKKQLKHLYSPSAKKVEMVEVPEMNFLMIDGAGDPNKSQSFQEVVEALFSVSYTLKFMIKKGETSLEPLDYSVLPLEGWWWSENLAEFSTDNKDDWLWTLMIRQPEFVPEKIIQDAKLKAESKKELPALEKMRFEAFEEGLAAQTLHIGPFAEEGPTIERIHTFIKESGHELRGKHHEIYLSDPRRTAPEKLKTVIRQPMGRPF